MNVPCAVADGRGRSLEEQGLEVRPIDASDEDRLLAFHASLSEDSVYYRFFAPHPRLSPSEVQRFTHVDGTDRMALVVLDGDRIVAVGRYDRLGRSCDAEVAFVVTDAYQHHGLASVLLARLADVARAHGIEVFVAETLPDNHRMRRVFASSGYPVTSEYRDGLVRVCLDVRNPPRTAGTVEA